MPTPHGKYWFITVGDEYFKPVRAMCPRRDLTFMMGQLEIGEETGYKHWHFSVGFSKEKTMQQCKEYFCREAKCLLSRSDAVDKYVWKEQTRVEGTQFSWGRKPMQMQKKADWDQVYECAKNGNHDEIEKGILVRNYSSIKKIRNDNLPRKMRGEILVHVYHGKTRTGKTRKSWFEAGNLEEVYIKDPGTKWWDGYRGETRVIIDEFTGRLDITHLLRWLDRYPCQVEVKGFTVPLMATEFWITSNLSPMDWYPEAKEEQVLALDRRLNDVHYFATEWVPPPPPEEEELLLDIVEPNSVFDLPDLGDFDFNDIFN